MLAPTITAHFFFWLEGIGVPAVLRSPNAQCLFSLHLSIHCRAISKTIATHTPAASSLVPVCVCWSSKGSFTSGCRSWIKEAMFDMFEYRRREHACPRNASWKSFTHAQGRAVSVCILKVRPDGVRAVKVAEERSASTSPAAEVGNAESDYQSV